MQTIEQNGRESLASVNPGNDPRVSEWADVLRELETYF
jgi:hypothetical protein